MRSARARGVHGRGTDKQLAVTIKYKLTAAQLEVLRAGARGQASRPPSSVEPGELGRAYWPAWAEAMAGRAVAEDRGIGDVIARVVGAIGGVEFAAWVKTVKCRRCPLPADLAKLNEIYPLRLT